MKLYISIPISGRPLQEAKNQAESIKAELTAHGHECITPFDVGVEPCKSYAHYMGLDIEALLGCEAVVLGYGWEHSNGCRLEQSAAKIYGLYLLYEEYLDQVDLSRMIYKHNSKTPTL